MSKPTALALIATASLLCLVTMAWESAISAWIFSLAVAVLPVALIALGVNGRRRGGRLGLFLILLALLQVGGIAAVLALAGGGGASIGGLPAATAILLYGVGLSTLVLTAGAYAATFSRHGIREQDLERLRRLRTEGRG